MFFFLLKSGSPPFEPGGGKTMCLGDLGLRPTSFTLPSFWVSRRALRSHWAVFLELPTVILLEAEKFCHRLHSTLSGRRARKYHFNTHSRFPGPPNVLLRWGASIKCKIRRSQQPKLQQGCVPFSHYLKASVKTRSYYWSSKYFL